MLISWFFLIRELGHRLAKEGTTAKSLLSLSYAIKWLCSVCAQVEPIWADLLDLSPYTVPLSPQISSSKWLHCPSLLLKLLLCHFSLPSDGKGMVGGLVDVAELCSRPALYHLCTSYHGLQAGKEEADFAPNRLVPSVGVNSATFLPGSWRHFISWWSWHLHNYSVGSGPSVGISLGAVMSES